MKKRMIASITRLAAFMLAVMFIAAGSGTMTVNAAPNDAGNENALTGGMYDEINTLDATVTIKTNSLKAKRIKNSFDFSEQMPKPTKVVVRGVTLKLNRDYTVSYQAYDDGWYVVENLTDPGLYRMCVEGKGNYSGVCTKRIYVYDAVESGPISSVSVAVNKMRYTGDAITSGVIKSVKYKRNALIEGDDYTVTYLNNTDSGTGIVRLTAVEGSGFIGEKDVKFQIKGGTPLSKAKITGITAKTYEYGNAVTQDMSQVKLTFKGETLVQDVDYSVLYYMNNTKVGTAKMVITGKGRFYGNVTKSFKINKIKLSADMLDDDSRSIVELHTKKAVKPDVTLYNSNGDQLVKGVDYTLAYKNNVKISDKAVITVKGKGNYAGSFNVNFKITDKKEDVEKPEKPEKPDDPKKPEKPENPEKPEKPEDSNKPEQPGETNPDETDTEETDTDDSDESGKDETDTDDSDKSGKEETDTDESGKDDTGTDDTEESGEDETGTDETGKDDTAVDETKIIGVRTCDCGYTVDIHVRGLSDSDKADWESHAKFHTRIGETVSFIDKYFDTNGTETEEPTGGTESSEDTDTEDSTEGTESGEDTDTEDPAEGTDGEDTDGDEDVDDGADADTEDTETGDGEETSEPDASAKPCGFRICACEQMLPIFTYGVMTDLEKETWQSHLSQHSANHESTQYTDVTYEKAIKYGIITEDMVFTPGQFFTP